MPIIAEPILDSMVKRGSDNRIIDLDQVFDGAGLSYTVVSSDPSVAAVTLNGSQLTVDFLETLGHSDLKIIAKDALGVSTTENVRVRVTGENAYTIAVLPDTQDYTNAAKVGIFKNMTNWLVDNKESQNIQFVVHVGDITTNNSDTAHWPFAEEALRILDGKIPYSLLPGNHDQNQGNAHNHSTDPLDIRFSPEKQAATSPTFGGVYDQEPTRSANTYHTFTAPDGTKWLVLSLEFGPRDDVLRWAGEVLEDHLDHQVILANHSYMNWAGRHDATGAPLYDEGAGYDYRMGESAEGANDGETMYRELVQKYSNIAFTFSGHIFGDAAETLVSYDQFGNPVHQMMVNYQNGVAGEITSGGGMGSGSNGGNGAIRLVTVDPDNKAVYTSTYFTELDDYLDTPRGDGELDRDGLTGPYRGHQETFENLDLTTPDLVAIAKAGNDKFVTAEAGQDKAAVPLDGDWTLNPGEDDDLSYSWTDRDGNVVSTEAKPTVQLGAGYHDLTLTVTDGEGRVSTDKVAVVVSTENTLLVDNFNDGNAAGWSVKPAPAIATNTGSASGFNLPALPGGDANVTYIPKLGPTQGIKVVAGEPLPEGANVVTSYSLVYDVLIQPGVASYFSFLQTDITNKSDQDLALKTRSATEGGIGINSDYEGTVKYGQWHRVAFTLQDQGTSTLITKYIDGVNVGTTTQSGGNHGRYAIDLNKGILLFADESNETANGYASSVLFTDKVFTDAEIAALGGPKAGGIVATQPSERSVQVNFSKPDFADDFGNAKVTSEVIGGAAGSGTGSFIVKGTAASRDTVEDGQAALEGRLFDQSDAGNNVLLWGDAAAKSWSNYHFETTIKTTDNDGVGVVFYYQDDKNHYRVALDAETNTRSLVKVVNGVETVLAKENGGTPWSRDFQLEVAVAGNEINVFIDGSSVFGSVKDANPLTGGTIGLYSNNQRSSQFDNVVVNKVALTAHAGDDVRSLDLDGDGKVTVALDAEGTFGLSNITSYVWKNADGKVVAEGKTANVTLDAGSHKLTLTVTDSAGKTATDTVLVEAVAKDKVLMSESFGSAASLANWTIVDEGEMGGVGPNGTASQWELRDGKYVQLSDLASRQLTWSGASNSDPWKTGWSPLGDGVNVLRKGTYALYNDAEAKEWSDYSVETTIQTPDNGALGVLVYYQDAKNYYKVELDANGDYDRTPGNGAGSLFQLIQVKDGVESYLNQFPAKYTPGQAFDLRVDVLDDKIQAYVNGEQLFAYAIESHAQTKGTVGLYSWGSAGVSFDDVTVVSLAEEDAGPGPQPGTNTPPVAVADEGLSTIKGAAITVAAAFLLANDTDANAGDVLSIASVQSATNGTVTLDADGNVVFTPTAGFVGKGSFTYTISDGKGGTATATVGVDVGAGANVSPVTAQDRLVGLENKPLTVSASTLLANDRDADGDTLSLVSVQNGTGGTVALVNGKVVFTPTAGFSGDAQFTYTVSDGKGGQAQGTVSVAVKAQPNRAPVAANDTVSTKAGIAATIAVAALLANDTDADADTLSVTAVSGAVNGTVSLADGKVVFTPTAGFSGEGSFTYTVSDGQGGTSTAKVVVNVAPQDAHEGWTKGTTGDDALKGSIFKANSIFGDAGNDTIRGGFRADRLDGGDGNDEINGGFGDDVINGDAGDDLLNGGSGKDTLNGGVGDDVLNGGIGNDKLPGGEGNDELYGGIGNDTLEGGAGDDLLNGGLGNDRLNGGEGDDVLTGGFRNDTFVFSKNSGADVITDFGRGRDVIDLAELDFGDFDDVRSATTQTEDGVMISLDDGDDNFVLLEGLKLTSLDADDFRFG
ncbi:cadherin-like domain-containing protein [Terrihabitans rhizophilus]|uniref:Cadherin-like domain-containing protein n=1 Tax=Terrihabitans rhizophilus TaxID=3092662 RepID=A0ABU4RMI8_9HYPH|nr:cadherin-like domain-containing protein [Terrihabitans sp. PJ23]MDX6804955.1 cadherin-like domain-containing protein [Terrihabitans sp. PJ23]